MLNNSIYMFISGWTLWFLTDKHPVTPGIMLPGESDVTLENFQLAFDILKAGYLHVSFGDIGFEK